MAEAILISFIVVAFLWGDWRGFGRGWDEGFYRGVDETVGEFRRKLADKLGDEVYKDARFFTEQEDLSLRETDRPD